MTSGKEKAHYLPMICLCEEDVMYSDRTHYAEFWSDGSGYIKGGPVG